MATLPTEILAHITQFVAREDLTKFRATSFAFDELSRGSFTTEYFQDIKISTTLKGFDTLQSIISNPRYGAAIRSITFNMNSVIDDITVLNIKMRGILNILSQKGQNVAIKVFIATMSSPCSCSCLIMGHFSHVIGYLLRTNIRLRLSPVPLTITMPPPAPAELHFPNRTPLLQAISKYSAVCGFCIYYTDTQGSVIYNAEARSIVIDGMEERHIREIRSLIRLVNITDITIMRCDARECWFDGLFDERAGTLTSVKLKDITLRH